MDYGKKCAGAAISFVFHIFRFSEENPNMSFVSISIIIPKCAPKMHYEASNQNTEKETASQSPFPKPNDIEKFWKTRKIIAAIYLFAHIQIIDEFQCDKWLRFRDWEEKLYKK